MRHCTARLLSVVPAAVLIALVGLAGPLAAQTLEEDDATGASDELVAASASAAVPPSTPTEVTIEVVVRRILAIDVRASQFEAAATLRAEWSDKDLLVEECASELVYTDDAATEMLRTTIWSPQFVVADAKRPRATSARRVSVDCEGTVSYQERFTTTVFQLFENLHEFPFDGHRISFEIRSLGTPSSQQVTFIQFPESERNDSLAADKLTEKYDSEQWDFAIEESRISDAPPSVTTVMRIDRKTRYYWMNVIGPLILIVAISWTVFWMGPNLAERLGVSITILLTVVAFDFLTSAGLPRLSFSTRLDAFYVASYVLVAFTILVSVSRHIASDRIGSALLPGARRSRWASRWIERHLDSWSRLIFPVAYGALAFLTLSVGAFSPGLVAEAEKPPDDLAPLPEAKFEQLTELRAGEPTTWSIETGDRHSYKVCAEEGETVSVVMARSDSYDTGFDPSLELYGETGEFFDADDDGAGGLDSSIVLPAVGCYRLVASDLTGERSGTYTLTKSTGTPVVDDETARPDLGVSGPLMLDGQPQTSAIEEPGEIDVYQVCKFLGDAVSVQMKRVGGPAGGSLDPLLELYDEDGSLVDFDDDGAGLPDSQLEFSWSAFGCFYFVARDLTGSGTGEYTITSDYTAPEPGTQPSGVPTFLSRSQPLMVNDSADAAIRKQRQADVYRVCGFEGDTVSVTMSRPAEAGDTLDPLLELYDDGGSLVSSDDDGAGDLDSRLDFSWPDFGCYLFVARDLTGEGVGRYTLASTFSTFEAALSERDLGDPELVFGDTVAELNARASHLELETVRDETIEAVEEVDAYRVCTSEGHEVSVTMQRDAEAPDNFLAPLLTAYLEDGTFVDSDDGAGGSSSQLVLDERDVCYVVIATDLFLQATGSYTLTVSGQ